MCGIFGQYTVTGGADRALVERMGQRLRHRGPDGVGFYAGPSGRLVFGAGRLAIIDLSAPPGPVSNEDNTVTIVFNGEIYNYQELRQELAARGHQFRTQTDTEVIVHGYESWGDSVLEHLRGMFAFCLYDQQRERLLLARDRLGEKPLYFWVSGAAEPAEFLFASEVKALLESSRVPRAVNRAALPYYLSLGYVPPPQTMFAGIEKLAPGERIVLDHGRITARGRYWEPTTHVERPVLPYPEAVRAVRAALDAAVQSRMVSDVPVGAFLSGGVDSTATTALMAQQTLHPVTTFTVGFDFAPGSTGDQKFNVDARYADLAAHTLKTDHHAVTLPIDGRLADLLPMLVAAMDEPVAQQSILQTVMVAGLARQMGVPVLLSGDAGDELFAGYDHYRLDRIVGRYRVIPRFVRAGALNPVLSHIGRARKLVEKSEAANPAERYLGWMRMIDPARLPALVADPAAARSGRLAVEAFLTSYLNEPEHRPFADRIAYASLRLWLAEDSNMRVDKMAMAMSVEARAPLEDHDLVDLALGLPLHYKLRQGDSKRIFKDAVADLVPEEIRRRPKWGFAPPTSEWLRTIFTPLVDRFLSAQNVAQVGIFDPSAVSALVQAHRSKASYEVWALWPLLIFHIWHALYISGELPLPAPAEVSGLVSAILDAARQVAPGGHHVS